MNSELDPVKNFKSLLNEVIPNLNNEGVRYTIEFYAHCCGVSPSVLFELIEQPVEK